MFSVLNINKPAGLTSHDVVARVRRILNIQKVGHAGTLDPQATGVLPLFIGQATRLLEYIATDKGYRAEITFGMTTTTWDGDGDIEHRCDTLPTLTPEAIEALLPKLLGDIEQTIPLYSAKRVDGKKLYERARAGEVVEELPTKKVRINSITLEALTTNEEGFPVATLQVHCGSGTFMRTLAYDLGQWLGCGAYLSGLIRTHHGQFTLETAVDLENWMESEDPKSYLQSPAPYLAIDTVVCVYPGVIQALFGGTNVLERQLILEAPQLLERLKQVGIKNQEHCLLTSIDTTPLGVVTWRNHALKPHKMFPVQADTQPQSTRAERSSSNNRRPGYAGKKRGPQPSSMKPFSGQGSIEHTGKMPISVADTHTSVPTVHRLPLPVI
ncbi:MAG: tRNA pseudouridine(55) synthase TruB [Vampirovibrionales bacterium]|nr:tRNA pseudouridine(55) synthase TruB [Vampirovibrionales bacterium]